MTITLDATVERQIEQKLKGGRYKTPQQVLIAAMDALSRPEAYAASAAELRAKIAVGVAEADRGELTDGEAFFAELDRELQAQDLAVSKDM